MRVTVLGSGTCASHLPGIPNRFPPGFLVEWGKGERMLFDCSEGVRFRLEEIGVDYASLEHVAISHAHPDHYALVHFLQAAYCRNLWATETVAADQSLHVYAPHHIVEDFPKLFALHNPDRGEEFWEWPELAFHSLATDTEKIPVGSALLSAANVHHGSGKIEALAFRLETPEGIFAYSGDTGECEGIRAISRDADIFVCEASARISDSEAPHKYGHLTPALAGDIASSGAVKKLILTHSTGADTDEAMIAACRASGYAGDIAVAKDFMRISC